MSAHEGLPAGLTVRCGDHVRLRIDGQPIVLEVVRADTNTQVLEGQTSTAAPIGAALLGKGPGEAVEVQTPSGTVLVFIVAIARESSQ